MITALGGAVQPLFSLSLMRSLPERDNHQTVLSIHPHHCLFAAQMVRRVFLITLYLNCTIGIDSPFEYLIKAGPSHAFGSTVSVRSRPTGIEEKKHKEAGCHRLKIVQIAEYCKNICSGSKRSGYIPLRETMASDTFFSERAIEALDEGVQIWTDRLYDNRPDLPTAQEPHQHRGIIAAGPVVYDTGMAASPGTGSEAGILSNPISKNTLAGSPRWSR
jgi:hypothetical protein